MKITITNYDKIYSVEYDNDTDIESVGDMFKGLLVSMGYHPCNVDELFNTEYKWFTQEERDENMQGHKKYNYTDPTIQCTLNKKKIIWSPTTKVTQKVGTKQSIKIKCKNSKTIFINNRTIFSIKNDNNRRRK